MFLRVLLIIFGVQMCVGQIALEEHIIEEALITNGPTDAILSDIDNDGDLDLVTASKLDNKIAWFKRTDGDDTFGFQSIISEDAVEALAVAAGDIDGDGDIDVLSAAEGGLKVVWYENLDGLGNFSDELLISAGESRLADADLVDLDDDGDLDVLVTGRKLTFFENTDGLGSFVAHVITADIQEYLSSYASDVDGDGDLDILYTKEESVDPCCESTVGWAENTDGAGGFDIIHELDFYSTFTQDILGADFDGDNDTDILIVTTGGIYNFDNLDGLGTFGEAESIIDISDNSKIAAKDLDADGDIDIVFGNYSIEVLENNGVGSFSDPVILADNVQFVQNVEIKDFDLDGDFDILSASFSDRRIAWHENTDGLGSFGEQIELTQRPKNPSFILAANVNGNCKLDVLIYSWVDGEVFGYENLDSADGFSSSILMSNDNPTNVSLINADFDGDGDEDLVLGPYGSSAPERLAWIENLDGEGTFGETTVLMEFPSHALVYSQVNDLDKDGDLDIILAEGSHTGGVSIGWFENTDAEGSFSSLQPLTSVDLIGLSVFNLADIDGDSDLDIVIAGSYWEPVVSEVVWLENLDGFGSFGPKRQLDYTNSGVNLYSSVNCVDMDGDGDLDAVTHAAYSNSIYWFENLDGAGNFGPSRIIQEIDFNRSIGTIDLDADGDLDVIASVSDSSGENRSLVYYEHLDGSGTFGERVTIRNFNDHFPRFTVADIDLDGDSDIAFAMFNRIGWYENLAVTSPFTCPESAEDDTDDPESVVEGTIPYPNPTTGMITVASENDIISLAIYNIVGDEVMSNLNSSELDISALRSGLYFLRVTHDDGSVVVHKIIKN